MRQLIKTEWLKIRNYPAFWIMIGMIALSYPGVNYAFFNVYKKITTDKNNTAQMAKMLLGEPFNFPEVWRTTAFFSSWFVFIPAVIVIMLITNEYSYRTHRQNIIDGWDKKDFLMAKWIDVLIVSLLVTACYAATTMIIGITQTSDPKADPFKLIHYTGLFALQTFSQLSIAFMVGLLVKKSFIALGVFLFYGLIVENVLVGMFKHLIFKNDIGRYLPMEVSDRLLPQPAFLGRLDEKGYQAMLDAIPTHVGLTFLVILITWAVCYFVYQKRDL
ncbi:ABC transporter permease [Flavihumibacter rivuli]|uniref:ABC transporter permease n=1 Tax=Flavihumibacter rivuli TaxID=2838156 RepID=UPI001BDEE904|nr:ABC transporter permease [Flavihumibacter rivuli]ULQ56546.1 ABC transporter permease [Flavihumibacter rivuli]